MILTIGGIDRSSYLSPSSISITDQLQSRNTARFTLRTATPSLSDIAVGQEIILESNGTRLFAGSVGGVTMNPIEGAETAAAYTLECVDFNELADRRVVAYLYESMSVGDIVRHIVNTFMAGEGISTAGVIAEGVMMEFALFNYNTVTTAFNDLSERTGLQWFIDYNKVLHFYLREDNLAPFSITQTSGKWRNLSITKNKEQYRNVQYVRGGRGTSQIRTEAFTGDGTRRTFTVSMPIAHTPTITVNGSAQTVGIGGVDTGRQWYWNKEVDTVSQDASQPPLTTSQELEVTFQGLYPIMVQSSSGSGINERQGVESGSGKYEKLDVDQKITAQSVAIDKAAGLLRRFGEIPETVTFETDLDGLTAGQLLDVSLPALGLEGQYLIDNIQSQDLDGHFLRHRVRILSGESFGGWITFFRKLTENNSDFIIRENEVLIRVLEFHERIRAISNFTLTTAVDSRVGFAVVGFSKAV